MPAEFIIYQLVDPRDHCPRYVGQTTQIKRRYEQHLAGYSSTSAMNAWLQELRKFGFQPIIQELEQVEGTQELARQRETDWIRRLMSEGAPLLNVSGAIDDTQATERVTAYFTSIQFDKIEELQRAYRKKTGKRINVNALLRRLVEYASVEDLL